MDTPACTESLIVFEQIRFRVSGLSPKPAESLDRVTTVPV